MKADDLLYYKSDTDYKQDACMVVVKTYPEDGRVLLDQYTNWENGTKSQAQYRGRQELSVQEAEQLFEPMTDYERIKAFSESISATFFKQTSQYIDFHKPENADTITWEAATLAHKSAVNSLMTATLDKTPDELCEEASYFEGPYAFDDVTSEEDKDYYADSSFYVGTYAGCNIYYDISTALDEDRKAEVYESDRNGTGGYGYIDNTDDEILLVGIPDDIKQKVQKQASEFIEENAEAEKRENLQENNFEVREGNDMVINDRLLPIEQDTKTLLVIEVQKQDENGNSYVVAAAAQSNENESIKAVVKGAMKGISKGDTLAFRLESYMAAHERYVKAANDDPEIKVVVSACENGKVLSSEEMTFSLEQFKNKDISFEKPDPQKDREF